MNKNLFINIITALQEQYDDDLAKAYLLGQVLEFEANPYDNSKLSDAIFKLLRLYFKEKTSDIEIFCWEQNFGRMNNVPIEKLWDFLQEPIRMKNNWDDNENDAKYGNGYLSTTEDLLKVADAINKSMINDATYSKKDLEFETMKLNNGIEVHWTPFDFEKAKNIEVKDIIIISPLKKR